MIVARKACLHHCRKAAPLSACFVDRNAEWRQPFEVHEQVVDKIFHSPVVVFSEHCAQCQTIEPTQGMIAHEGEALAIGRRREVFNADDIELCVKEFQTILYPYHALLFALLVDKAVYVVLVDNFFQPSHYKARNIARLASHFAFEYLVDVNSKIIHVTRMVENSVRKNVTKLLIIFLFSQKINKLKHFYVVCKEKNGFIFYCIFG